MGASYSKKSSRSTWIRISTLFNNGPRQPGESVLLGYGEAKISAEPSGIPSPSGPDFRDQPLLSPEQDPDAAGNLDRLLTLPNGNRRRGPRAPVVLHDGLCLLGQLLLPLPCEAVIPAVPSSPPNLDIGNPTLFPVDLQGNAWIAPPPGDCDCMLAGPDGYPSFQRCSPPSHLRENHSNPPPDIESRQLCLPLRRCTRFFSQRPQASSLVVLVGWDWSRTSRPSSLEGGVGVSPTGAILFFPQGGVSLLLVGIT